MANDGRCVGIATSPLTRVWQLLGVHLTAKQSELNQRKANNARNKPSPVSGSSSGSTANFLKNSMASSLWACAESQIWGTGTSFESLQRVCN